MAMRLDRGQIEVVDDAMAEVLRKKAPGERIRIGFAIWESSRRMAAYLGKIHPEWNTQKIQEEVARRLLRGPA